jgi:hypothetical protein
MPCNFVDVCVCKKDASIVPQAVDIEYVEVTQMSKMREKIYHISNHKEEKSLSLHVRN